MLSDGEWNESDSECEQSGPQPSGGQKRNRMRKSALKPVLYTFFSILAVA